MEAVGNLSGVLSSSRASQAQQIPWVAAIRGYGASISASGSGLTFSYRVDTGGRSLSASQLPIAPGSSAPSFAGGGPIAFALNNPAQLVTFVENAEQSTSPSKYSQFQRRQSALRSKTGADLNSLLKLLTGTAALSSDTRTTVARVGVSDAGKASQVLSKLMSDPGAAFGGGTTAHSLGGGFYHLKERKTTLTIGVVANQLVVGRASHIQLQAFAGAPSTAASGAKGSLAFRVSLPQLLQLALKRTPSKTIQTVLGSLGDYTGWTASSPSGLTGSATLGLK
jgi:hypothetical protein